jgi:hypothetical protein
MNQAGAGRTAAPRLPDPVPASENDERRRALKAMEGIEVGLALQCRTDNRRPVQRRYSIGHDMGAIGKTQADMRDQEREDCRPQVGGQIKRDADQRANLGVDRADFLILEFTSLCCILVVEQRRSRELLVE